MKPMLVFLKMIEYCEMSSSGKQIILQRFRFLSLDSFCQAVTVATNKHDYQEWRVSLQ